jgi:hypothetical protein
MNIGHWNIRKGLIGNNPKLITEELADFILHHDIAFLSETNYSVNDATRLSIETFLRRNTTEPQIRDILSRYTIYEKFSSKHAGGGLAAFVRKDLPHSVAPTYDPDLDLIQINAAGLSPHSVYLPPNNSASCPLRDLYTAYASTIPAGSFVGIGDLNASLSQNDSSTDVGASFPTRQLPPNTKPKTKPAGRMLIALCQELELVILNGRKGPGVNTRYGNEQQMDSILDYGIVSHKLYESVSGFETGDHLQAISDHCPISIVINTEGGHYRLRGDEALEKVKPPSNPWTWNCTGIATKIVEKALSENVVKGLKSLSAEDFTDRMTEILAEAARSARREDTTPNIYMRSAETRFAWEHSPERDTLVAKSRQLARRLLKRDLGDAERRDIEAQKREIAKEFSRTKRKIRGEMLSNRRSFLEGLQQGDPANLFRVLKNLGAQRSAIPITFDELVGFQTRTVSEDIITHVPHDESLSYPAQRKATIGIELLSRMLTLEEYSEVKKKIQNGKAGDLRGIRMELFKYGPRELDEVIIELFNKILAGEKVDNWGEVLIQMLHKKGARDDANNYRGISIPMALEKLFSIMMSRRLVEWTEKANVLCSTQFGFRPHRSTVDAVFIAESLLRLARKRKNKLILVFVDFKKAFDTVKRSRLWEKLEEMGVPKEVLEAFQNVYGKIKGTMRGANGEKSDLINFLNGVKQGDPLSTLFFILMINDMDDFLRLNGAKGVSLKSSDPSLTLSLIALFFADDTTLIASNLKDAQLQLDLLSQYASWNSLEVNVGKTEWMAIGIPLKAVLCYRNQPITRISSFKFLGFHLTSTSQAQVHVASLRARMLIAYGTWRRYCLDQPGMTPAMALQLYGTFVDSVGQYGNPLVQSWPTGSALAGHSKRDESSRLAIRTVLHLPASTPVAALFVTTGLYPLVARDHIAALRFLISLPKKDPAIQQIWKIIRGEFDAGKDNGNLAAYYHELVVFYGGDEGEEMWKKDAITWTASKIEDMVLSRAREELGKDMATMKRVSFMRRTGIRHGQSRALEIWNPGHRDATIRLLTGTHKLGFETGRYFKISPHRRTCTCGTEEIDDEEHFLFDCGLIAEGREQLRSKLERMDCVWSKEGWSWMNSWDGGKCRENEESLRRSALRATAAFIYNSFKQRGLLNYLT